MAKLQDIISHSCEEKHKRDWGFPVFEGKYFRLLCTFLELWGGGSPIPGFPVPAQHPSEVLLLRGPEHPAPQLPEGLHLQRLTGASI